VGWEADRVVEAARGLDVEIRAGIHTGEIERGETGIGGIAVHIAARLLGPAESGQVVVTKTVRDLVTGTDLAFRPLGAASLRGVPGEWELSKHERRIGETARSGLTWPGRLSGVIPTTEDAGWRAGRAAPLLAQC